MSNADPVESIVREKLSFLLQDYNFKGPKVHRDSFGYTISYISNEIAIELEVDLRDVGLSVLVTKMDNGRLPGGYYMSKGERVRIQLNDVLREYFHVETVLPMKGKSKKRNRGTKPQSQQIIEDALEFHRNLLSMYAEKLIQAGIKVFYSAHNP